MYTKNDIEKLLMQHFNDAWDMDNEYAPEPGMPKAQANPATQGGIWAEKIDLQRSLAAIPLSVDELLALEHRFGGGLSYEDMGPRIAASSTTAFRLITGLVDELVDEMNTGAWRLGKKQDRSPLHVA